MSSEAADAAAAATPTTERRASYSTSTNSSASTDADAPAPAVLATAPPTAATNSNASLPPGGPRPSLTAGGGAGAGAGAKTLPPLMSQFARQGSFCEGAPASQSHRTLPLAGAAGAGAGAGAGPEDSGDVARPPSSLIQHRGSFSAAPGSAAAAAAAIAATGGAVTPTPGPDGSPHLGTSRRVCTFPGCRALCVTITSGIGSAAATLGSLAPRMSLVSPAMATMSSGSAGAAAAGGSPSSFSAHSASQAAAVAAAATAAALAADGSGGADPPSLLPRTSSTSSSSNVQEQAPAAASSAAVASVPLTGVDTPLYTTRARGSLSFSSPTSAGLTTTAAAAASTGTSTSAGGPQFCLRHASRVAFPEVAPSSPHQWAAAMELVSSEASYHASLELAVRDYVERVDAAQALGTPIITVEDARRVFHNLRNIAALSSQLLTDLSELKGLRNERGLLDHISLILLHYAPLLSSYRGYLENFDAAAALVPQLCASTPRFAELCAVNTHMHGGLTLPALLVMPVQRLPRYALLMKELVRHTPATDPALEAMTQALEAVTRVTAGINQQLSEKENQAKVWAFQTRLERDERYVDLMAPGRRLLREGLLKKRYSEGSFQLSKDTEYYFVLFSDMLLYAAEKGSFGKKTYKVKHCLQLRGMVVACESLKGRQRDILLRSTSSNGKVKELVVSFPSEELRDAWHADIAAAVRACDAEHTGKGTAEALAQQHASSKLANLL